MFNASSRLFRSASLAALVLSGSSCTTLSDGGTQLAFALERESLALIASGQEELVFDYWPLSGIDQHFEIRLSPSRSPQPPYGGYVVVTGENGGGTSYQGRFVYIVSAMQVSKVNEAAHITLRNHGGRIELVALR